MRQIGKVIAKPHHVILLVFGIAGAGAAFGQATIKGIPLIGAGGFGEAKDPHKDISRMLRG